MLKSILGHKSIAMTQRNAHLAPEYKRSMLARMEKIWTKSSVQPVVKPGAEYSRRLARGHGRVTKAAAVSA